VEALAPDYPLLPLLASGEREEEMASKRFMSPQAGQEHPNIYQLLMQMPSQTTK